MNISQEWNLNLTAEHILRAQGSDPEIIRNRKPRLYEIAEWAIHEGEPFLEPTVAQETYSVERLVHQKLLLMNDNSSKRCFLSGPLIAEHLATAQTVEVIVCTIGDTLEKLAAELMNTDPLYGWALDSLGSTAVEMLANQACNIIESQAKAEGLYSSISLSPGMIGWPVESGQSELFNLIETSPIGVYLNNYAQMHPGKSLSLVIGTGTKAMISGKTCDYCALNTTCQYRDHYS